MRITVHCDASFSIEHSKGAWACWIRGDGFVHKRAGKIKTDVDDNNLCELMAIANSIALLARRVPLEDCELLIKTDSQNAIAMIRGGKTKDKYVTVVRYIVANLSKARGWRVAHVKGHMKKGIAYGSQHFINGWCDRSARKHLRELIKGGSNEQIKAKTSRRHIATKKSIAYKQRQKAVISRVGYKRSRPYQRAKIRVLE